MSDDPWRPIEQMRADDAACAPTWFTGPQSATSRAMRDRRALLQELAEHERSFNLRWKADMRAIERWRAAGPDRELTMPDHADLCVWLLDQLGELGTRDDALPPLCLEVGLSMDERDVIVNHPEMIPSPEGRGGHIFFTPKQAIEFAELLLRKAAECKLT